ncbi:MAG TPA: VOC family protein [Aggregatilineales bacterium]|nr:VOC family protein [Aggregatilineales bacterium]
MMIRKIDAAVLFVKDRARCMLFYRDILGLSVTFSDSNSDAFRLEEQDFVLLDVAAAAEMIGEEALSLQQEAGHRVLLCAGVEDVDATYKMLTAKGVAFIKTPKSQPWGRRTAYFADPEGNIWEIWHSLPPEHQQ